MTQLLVVGLLLSGLCFFNGCSDPKPAVSGQRGHSSSWQPSSLAAPGDAAAHSLNKKDNRPQTSRRPSGFIPAQCLESPVGPAWASPPDQVQVFGQTPDTRADSASAIGPWSLEKLIADCNQALAKDETSAEAHILRGLAYFNADYEQALQDFNQALSLEPKRQEIYLFRAELFKSQGRADLARMDYAKAFQLDGDKAPERVSK